MFLKTLHLIVSNYQTKNNTMHLRKLHNKSHYVHKYKISLTIFHTSIETGDPKDILSRDDHVYRNEWMQKQQRMFQTEPIFVSNIKLFQIHM